MGRKILPRTLARQIVEVAFGAKAEDIVVLDISKIADFADYFVIASGTSRRHIQTIADKIIEDQEGRKRHYIGLEGYEYGEWVLVDYGSVIVHIFHPQKREFYALERLWGDARRVVFRNVFGKTS
jgi:ribosome-associated protein